MFLKQGHIFVDAKSKKYKLVIFYLIWGGMGRNKEDFSVLFS